jgi:hypothetical protein
MNSPAHTLPTMTGTATKTCRTCSYFLHRLTYMGGEYDYKVIESRCAIKLLDPVTGETGEPECQWARTWPHHCGWEGRYWKAKPLPGLGVKP